MCIIYIHKIFIIASTTAELVNETDSQSQTFYKQGTGQSKSFGKTQPLPEILLINKKN